LFQLLRDEGRVERDWHSGSVVKINSLGGDLMIEQESQWSAILGDFELGIMWRIPRYFVVKAFGGGVFLLEAG
jgi:hypothetical protein